VRETTDATSQSRGQSGRMGVPGVSIVIAAASVVAASTFYGFQIRNQVRVRKTDLVMRLYATWDSLEFQKAFHTVYWADFDDYDSAMAITGGERQLWTFLLSFYDQVGVLLRRHLIEFDMVDDLLGNSTRQLWEKVEPMIREARERYDPRLYEHFEFLYDEMTRRAELGQPSVATAETAATPASQTG
jgi:hypothetical protein